MIADYKAKEAKKADKGKEGEKEKEKADSPKPTSIPASPASPPPATHRKFALHRQVFEMRQSEIKRKEQGVKAREVGKGAPPFTLLVFYGGSQ